MESTSLASRQTNDKNQSTEMTPSHFHDYVRKSTLDDGSAKSIADQHEVNMETAEEFGLPLRPENCHSEKEGLSTLR